MIISKRKRSLSVVFTIIVLIAVCVIDVAITPTAYASSHTCQNALNMQEDILNNKIKTMIKEKERKKELLLQKKKKEEERRIKLEQELKERKLREERLKQLENGECSYEEVIFNEASSRGLDGSLAVAISKLETGSWTSNAFVNKNNFGGLMNSNGLMYFNTKKDGLDAYLNTLENYRGVSIEAMGNIYCTDGSDWSAKVRSLMK